MAKEFGVPFLGEIEIDPQIRIGGDTGKPVASLGEDAPGAKSIYAVARNVVARLEEVNAASWRAGGRNSVESGRRFWRALQSLRFSVSTSLIRSGVPVDS